MSSIEQDVVVPLNHTTVAFTLRDLIIVLASIVSTTMASTVAWVNLNSADTLAGMKIEQQGKEVAELQRELHDLRDKLIAEISRGKQP